MDEPVVVVDGLRTPYAKAWGAFDALPADELGRIVVAELLTRLDLDPLQVDAVVVGNVAQPGEAANIARVIALRAHLPEAIPAHTVHRNCASGMEAIAEGVNLIRLGQARVVVAGGVESMSNIPLLFSRELQRWFMGWQRARRPVDKLVALTLLRPAWFKPVVGLRLGLTDPVCGLNMGETAEVVARDFAISRVEQDRFALRSHQRTEQAIDAGRLAEEIVPVYPPPGFAAVVHDDGLRRGQTMEALAKLKPVFDRAYGTITAGNASQITDGGAAVVLMAEGDARARGYLPLGRVTAWAFAGNDPARMGLGPVHAIRKLLKATGLTLADFDLVEINEAFAAQVLGCLRALDSSAYFRDHFDGEPPLGAIDEARLNVNGGAIALGHPVGSSGTRLLLTLLKELRRRSLARGLATLCIGGGQGAAFVVEVC
ncbi:MAG: acetyl-CoA C-acyltransferase [Nitrospirae bacterium CG18_big_fil_WC_8_21_14_2_50_70_55]|nr:thiolase family protein [Deltaproteobacteria bacterium]NCP95535.1 thiolase family protein [Deltaproteobacteria bacterium]NCS73407.1 thiolase family protein [Deltaproteobacteria bacterium]PIQ06711.1 MAG: acetyl-CoA C-acyltransferase [Nitrospirae bacterium CG18_big_fil_WC_8_21_14_2_50_70_55]PIW83194.1 MAG: acetyl-CoA C-acyltransferase [Nitrospirae bacterium CG_4_8_14_3_um_filter_70_85]